MQKKPRFSALVFDLFLILLSFFIMDFIQTGKIGDYLYNYPIPFIIFGVFWILISLIGDKYRFPQNRLSDHLNKVKRVNFVILATVVIFIYFFHLLYPSRTIVFGSILSLTVLETISLLVFYSHLKLKKKFDLSSSLTGESKFIEVSEDTEQKPVIFKFSNLKNIRSRIRETLNTKYLKNYPELFKFADNLLNLNGIDRNYSSVLNTHTIFNIQNIKEDSQQLFINLHRVNDIRRINEFFIQVNKNLQHGGYFICNAVTNLERQRSLKEKYHPVIFYFVYIIHFIFNRVIPKIPIFKETYFFFTKGHNRPLSKAEVLGRLSFCGFKIHEYKTINNNLYIISQKINLPSLDTSPTYGPFIKLKRNGKNGETIFVYKLRTMHPYSEYIHGFLAENHGYLSNGKLKNDFRKPLWGKFLRRTWLDEIPQLINLLRGELSLVGLRSFSNEYLKNYPDSFVNKRQKYKPGCIPTYISLNMDNGHEARIESEKIYIKMKEKHPILTDIKFFFMAVNNILSSKVSSN